MPKYTDFELDLQNIEIVDRKLMKDVGSDGITPCDDGGGTGGGYNPSYYCSDSCPYKCS